MKRGVLLIIMPVLLGLALSLVSAVEILEFKGTINKVDVFRNDDIFNASYHSSSDDSGSVKNLEIRIYIDEDSKFPISFQYNGVVFEGERYPYFQSLTDDNNEEIGGVYYYQDIDLISADGNLINGDLELIIEDGKGTTTVDYHDGTVEEVSVGMSYEIRGVYEDYSSRISGLESWKNTINSWKESIAEKFTDISNSLAELASRINSQEAVIQGHEERIEEIESSGPVVSNGTFPVYLNYLSSSDRKKIACGFAEDNKLDHLEALGYNCSLTYKTYSSGKVKVSCKCK